MINVQRGSFGTQTYDISCELRMNVRWLIVRQPVFVVQSKDLILIVNLNLSMLKEILCINNL